VPFYVPLGPRGLVFRLGSLLTGIIGGLVYRRACRKRARASAPAPLPILGPMPERESGRNAV